MDLTGDPDIDRQILDARAAQGGQQFAAYQQQQKAAGTLPEDYIIGLPGGKPGVMEIGVSPTGERGPFYQQVAYSTPEEYREAYNLKLQTPFDPSIFESGGLSFGDWLGMVAGVLIPGVAPALGAALGAATGLGSAASSALTGAALGAGKAALTDDDILQGALTGGLSGFGKGALDTASGVASLGDAASTGASVADTVSTTGGILDVLDTAVDIATSPVGTAVKDYIDAMNERPGYTPQPPTPGPVTPVDTGDAEPPGPPAPDIEEPGLPEDEETIVVETEDEVDGGGEPTSGAEEDIVIIDDTVPTAPDAPYGVIPEGFPGAGNVFSQADWDWFRTHGGVDSKGDGIIDPVE